MHKIESHAILNLVKSCSCSMDVAIMRLSPSLSSIRRVFISNLQKEIEKQKGHHSSRRRRSESQYDYEVYHSLEEVDAKHNIYPPVSHPLLPSNRMHTQNK